MDPNGLGSMERAVGGKGLALGAMDKRAFSRKLRRRILDGSSRTTEKTLAFTPCLHLHTERMWVSAGEGLFDEGREELVPVITLTFDYAGVRVRAADRRTRFFVAEGDGVGVVGRD